MAAIRGTEQNDACAVHEEDIINLRESNIRLDTTIKNGRWIIGIMGGIATLMLTFFGWVATDNLTAIRTKIDNLVTLYNTNQVELTRLQSEVRHLREWQESVNNHINIERK